MKTLTAKLILGAAILVPVAMFGQYTEGVINIPGSDPFDSSAQGIDANDQVVGIYAASNVAHSFVYSQGVLAQVDVTGSFGTWAMGVDATKGMVGYEFATASGYMGFIDGGRQFKLPRGDQNRYYTGINASGTLVGYDSNGHGFISINGTITNVVPAPCASLPAPRQVYIYGVNAHNDFVGYCKASGFDARGFARIGGVDQQISVFGTAGLPYGINDSGTMAGTFTDPQGRAHGFILSNGTPTQFDFGTLSQYYNTRIYGINNKGSVAGQAVDANSGFYVAFYAFHN